MQLKIIHIIQVSDIDTDISKYSFMRFLRVSLVPRHDAENNRSNSTETYKCEPVDNQCKLGCKAGISVSPRHHDYTVKHHVLDLKSTKPHIVTMPSDGDSRLGFAHSGIVSYS